jgi:glucokinase
MEREKQNHAGRIMEHAIVIGVDIGGSHITAAQIHMGNKQLVPGTEQRHHVDPHGKVDSIITAWSKCILAAAGNHPLTQICIAMPGPFDYDKGISLIKGLHKYAALYELNVKELLVKKLSVSTDQIFLHNDAACFLQGEVFGGSMVGYHPVIGITLGTGLGSATCKEAVSQDGGWWAYPFKGTIAEDHLSTRWFIQRWQEISGDTIRGVKELADKIKADARIQTLFNEFATNLATVLTAFIQQESPQAIVIGGNIAHAFPLFKEPLLLQVQAQFPAVVIRVSQLGEKAALLGAAGSWQALNYKLLPH